MYDLLIHLFLGLGVLCLSACLEENQPTGAKVSPLPKKINFLALGDSYTIGEGVKESERWPEQLAERLKNDRITVGKLKIIARTGWRTDQLFNAIQNETDLKNFQLVSLLIGVNDQYQGRDTAAYRSGFEVLLEKAIELAGGKNDKVFVLSIPDYGVTPFGKSNAARIAKEIDEFNALNRRISEQKKVSYFDITAISRQAADNLSLLAEDGLHPSGKMYQLWVDLIYEQIRLKAEQI